MGGERKTWKKRERGRKEREGGRVREEVLFPSFMRWTDRGACDVVYTGLIITEVTSRGQRSLD